MGRFLEQLMAAPEVKPLLSNVHSSVDGTLLQAWASHASLDRIDGEDDPPPPPSGPGEGFGEARTGKSRAKGDFRGIRLSNKTHRSGTDPDALLARKSNVHPALPSYRGHVLMDNRHALVVNWRVTQADRYGERQAAKAMAADLPGAHQKTIGADKNYDTRGFVAEMRRLCVTLHVAQNSSRSGGSAIDGRTTRLKVTPNPFMHAGASRKSLAGSRSSVDCASSSCGVRAMSVRVRTACDRLQPDPTGQPAQTVGGDSMNGTFSRRRGPQGVSTPAKGPIQMVMAG